MTLVQSRVQHKTQRRSKPGKALPPAHSIPELQTQFYNNPPIVIAGGGPAGNRAAQELSRLGHDVVLFNAERWRPYNRVKLTPLLSGEVQVGQIYLSEKFSGPGIVKRYDGVSVVDVDRSSQKILTSTNKVLGYNKLILALGSHAFIPDIPGADLQRVYTFRNFNDTEALLARSLSAREVVVIGGGLLGLEAARGMLKRGANVTIIEHENRLMPRQLDEQGAQLLRHKIESLGLITHTATRVKSIEGANRAESVVIENNKTIAADTVIICTGVRSNTQLPAAIGLEFNRGVRVNDTLQTTDPDIYAIGECAEHNDCIYGLVGPGFEQATFVANHIHNLLKSPQTATTSDAAPDNDTTYRGSVPTSRLKILGVDIFTTGDFESLEQTPGIRSVLHSKPQQGIYRRILFNNNRLVAAIGVGEWAEASRIQQSVALKSRFRWWQTRSFKRNGVLFGQAASNTIHSEPATAIICNCTGTSKGAITDAICNGATSLEAIRSSTGANSVCGTCTVDINELLGKDGTKSDAVAGWKFILVSSIIAIFLTTTTYLSPPVQLQNSFDPNDLMRLLWFDTTVKQWSGYTLLALTGLAAVLGIRKRLQKLKLPGKYDNWRIFHLITGLLTLVALFAHTGFRLGSNLNKWLMLSFLACLIFGAVAGLMTGSEHRLKDQRLLPAESRPRTLPTWLHIIALWPLPVLLLIHVLMVYTY